ncbi:unnamed protein product [Schistosoma curassoni]|uniref:Uncharacterized protein n=1 Tax=Schistosoma curassoni TaxID=6186 RepID=A0A183L6Z1_9TREM|nr:unnamed protein product [Schistosoma curassoni]
MLSQNHIILVYHSLSTVIDLIKFIVSQLKIKLLYVN